MYLINLALVISTRAAAAIGKTLYIYTQRNTLARTHTAQSSAFGHRTLRFASLLVTSPFSSLLFCVPVSMMRISPGVTNLSVGPVTMLSYPPAPETAMRSVGVGRRREGRDAGQGDVGTRSVEV